MNLVMYKRILQHNIAIEKKVTRMWIFITFLNVVFTTAQVIVEGFVWLNALCFFCTFFYAVLSYRNELDTKSKLFEIESNSIY